ncbi:MAG: sodium:solute symporter [Bacteroidetes bacterium HGW-Bacteroidetes-6]|jgi:Na+/proline symporter|nr:MAG: sodium:solute symporter [Bacteroidetes bacterium HGW-Bacteroidetes-6]
MKIGLILTVFIVYTLLLFFITWLTSRKANNETYFIGNRRSLWYIVAYGMIGASLSGVTFMSVPGWVGETGFSYFMVVLGYFLGYLVISFVLLPLYYKLNLTSIYTYLEQRFGFASYKTGAMLFVVSRSLGASLRMFLVVNVLQIFLFNGLGVPFVVTACIFILLVLLYTFQGGIKTIVWTDTLQTTFMLGAMVFTIASIASQMNLSVVELVKKVADSSFSYITVTDFTARNHWLKQLLSGAFITITMTGLDQEMMQKNLSCKNLRDARKNMLSFSVVLIFVNMLFLFLGASLFLYADTFSIPIPALPDDLFATISLHYLPPLAGIVFLVGLISAAYPSADGAITSLTTSFSIDILKINRLGLSEKQQKRKRLIVHFSFAILLLSLIIMFSYINDRSIIDKLFTIAGYTYGPLLGLYSFGLFTRLQIHDKWVLVPVLAAPMLSYLLSIFSEQLLSGYKVGFELLIINGFLTFIGLLFISKRGSGNQNSI